MGASDLGLSSLFFPVVKLKSTVDSKPTIKKNKKRSYRNYTTCKFHFLSSILGSFLLGSIICSSASNVNAGKRLCDQLESNGETTAKVCDSNLCFALWKVANGTGDTVFLKQGCWENSPRDSCHQVDCVHNLTVSSKGQDPLKPHFFCCCSEDNCNGNVSVVEIIAEDEEEEKDHLDDIYADSVSSPDSLRTSIAAVVAVIIGVSVALVVFVGVYYAWKNQIGQKPNQSDDFEAGEKLMEPLAKSQVCWEISDVIVLGEEIAKGKFATVCSGRIGGMEVALKVFSADEREYFENEKFIFSILGNKQQTATHSYIVNYHGWQEFSVDNSTSLILALDRIRPGNLRDFLIASENDTLPIASVMKIMSGICVGLSYLHGENKDEVVIAHRDLTTKNILIDENLNCYISDFGLSLLTNGSSYFWAGRERQAEFCSLAEAGTLRYMSPELLEGAVNLKDCENALKQADIYALALILWEVANLSHDIALPSHCRHRLPYEQEIGKDICIESLARVVVSRRDRPSFSGWRDTPITRSIRDTLNESWDPEPDARLTASTLCIRFAELHHNKHNAADSTTPLEGPPTPQWAGRNPCMERNLLEENSEDKSTEFLLTSEKHLIPKGPTSNTRIMFMGSGASVSSVSDQSFSGAATTNTDLSNSSAQTHPLHIPNPPIPFVQNIFR